MALLIATVSGSGLPGFFNLPEEGMPEDKMMPVEGDLCQKQMRQMSMALKSCYENSINSNEMNYQIGRIPRGKTFL